MDDFHILSSLLLILIIYVLIGLVFLLPLLQVISFYFKFHVLCYCHFSASSSSSSMFTIFSPTPLLPFFLKLNLAHYVLAFYLFCLPAVFPFHRPCSWLSPSSRSPFLPQVNSCPFFSSSLSSISPCRLSLLHWFRASVISTFLFSSNQIFVFFFPTIPFFSLSLLHPHPTRPSLRCSTQSTLFLSSSSSFRSFLTSFLSIHSFTVIFSSSLITIFSPLHFFSFSI